MLGNLYLYNYWEIHTFYNRYKSLNGLHKNALYIFGRSRIERVSLSDYITDTFYNLIHSLFKTYIDKKILQYIFFFLKKIENKIIVVRNKPSFELILS